MMHLKNPNRAAEAGYTAKQRAAVLAAVEALATPQGAARISLQAICEQASEACERGHVEQILVDAGYEVTL